MPPALRFARPHAEWESIKSEVGAGWFMDRFLYLFGPGLDELTECLDAWPFLVPLAARRMVIGRNAYGALLVLENGDDAERQRVYVLDPVTVRYWSNPAVGLRTLCADFLPQDRLPGFLDRDAYLAWRAANGTGAPRVREILGVRLGGALTPDDLVPCDIVEYYRSAAPAHQQAYDALPFTDYPQFRDQQWLDSSHTWTAVFDSYNQRTEDLYYAVDRYENGRLVDHLTAELDAWRGGMAWTLPVFAEMLRREIEDIARSGASNTEYQARRPGRP